MYMCTTLLVSLSKLGNKLEYEKNSFMPFLVDDNSFLLWVMIASLLLVFKNWSQVIKIINNSCLLLLIQVVEYLNGK